MHTDPASTEKEQKQRTAQQNRALHLYFQLVADTLNDAGLDMRAVLKPDVHIPWSKSAVKEFLWRPVQEIQLGKRSTTDLTTKDIDAIFDTINRHLANHGVHQPFPSIDEIFLKMEQNYPQAKIGKKADGLV